MGARRVTLVDFYAENGFGQVSGRSPATYAEFPTQNVKLQELYRHVAPDAPVLKPILGQLDLARVYQEQGQHLQASVALAEADQLLNQALAHHGPGGRKWVIALVVVLAVLAALWMASRRRRPRLRRNARRQRRRRRLPPPTADADADEDEDEDEDADAGGGEDDDADEEAA